jgi:CO/xanthine dehydrogenase FAD-binding subunit
MDEGLGGQPHFSHFLPAVLGRIGEFLADMTSSSRRHMEVLHPDSVAEALLLAARGDARLVAGGTALQLEWAQGTPQPGLLVDLGRIRSLRGVKSEKSYICAGALTPLVVLQRDPRIAGRLPLLSAAARVTAGSAVRYLATIGGNVAGRKGCLLPALLALGAKVEVATAAVRAILPLEQWLAAPPEAASVIEALVIPVPAEPIRWAFRKGGLRAAFTPSVINVAGLKEIEGDRVSAGRLAVGGGVVSPMRVRGAEALITGRPLGATTGPRYIWRCLQKPPLRMTPSAPDAIAASSQRTRLCMLSAESC